MFYKTVVSVLAIVLTCIAFYPYIRGILQGTIRPHLFSWLIWSIASVVVFLAQVSAHGGVGTWSMGLSGGLTVCIAVLAYVKQSDTAVTRSDVAFLITALLSLPLWYFTADPLGAVIILTVVDLLGFGPTFRKVYADPMAESLTFYGLFSLRNVLAIVALESYSVTTVLFPVTITAGSALLMIIMFHRRRVLGLDKNLLRADL